MQIFCIKKKTLMQMKIVHIRKKISMKTQNFVVLIKNVSRYTYMTYDSIGRYTYLPTYIDFENFMR